MRQVLSARSRRPLASRSVIRLCVPLAATLALAGCGSSHTTQTGSASAATGNGVKAATLLTTTPQAKGTLKQMTWDLPLGEPTSLDPVQVFALTAFTMDGNLCDPLRRLNPNYTYSPNLASSWTYSPNHLILTYTLRKGVKFWDGHPLTSADVVYSLLRNMNIKNQPVDMAFFSNVKSITPDGPYKVVVKFKKPDELFNNEMAGTAGQISEKSYVEAKGSAYGTPSGGLMCSGPYELKKWNSGSDLVLTANNRYWNPALRPKVQTVIVKFITDTGTLVQALRSGEIDGTFDAPSAALPALRSISTGKVYLGKSSQSVFLNAAGGPGADAKIRQALSLVIDRNAIAAKIYNGAAQANYTLMPSTWWDPTAVPTYRAAYRALNIPKAVDTAAAKKLIAGDPNASKPIVIYTVAGDQTELNASTLIQEEAAGIGLHVKVEPESNSVLHTAETTPSGRKGVSFFYDPTYTGVPDPLDNLLSTVLPHSDGGTIEIVNYDQQERVAQLLKQAQSTFDPAKRAGLISKAQAIWHKDRLAVSLVTPDEILFMSNKISGAPASFAAHFMPSLASVGAAK